jgi:NAD(P)H-flavin reductase
MQSLECQVSYLRDVGDTMILQLAANSDAKLDFEAGQYLMMAVADSDFKPFSIASIPSQNHLELHIRDNPDNNLKSQIHAIHDSDGTVQVQLPAGECTLARANLEQPILFVAGGTGYAPCHAMIQALFAMQSRPAISLYWGGAELQDLYLHRELQLWASQQLGFMYTAVVQENDVTDASVRQGLVHEAVLADVDQLADYDIYVSGSGPMVGAVYKALVDNGADANSIYSDMLDLGYAEIPPG